jgi:hypothetical protein
VKHSVTCWSWQLLFGARIIPRVVGFAHQHFSSFLDISQLSLFEKLKQRPRVVFYMMNFCLRSVFSEHGHLRLWVSHHTYKFGYHYDFCRISVGQLLVTESFEQLEIRHIIREGGGAFLAPGRASMDVSQHGVDGACMHQPSFLDAACVTLNNAPLSNAIR